MPSGRHQREGSRTTFSHWSQVRSLGRSRSFFRSLLSCLNSNEFTSWLTTSKSSCVISNSVLTLPTVKFHLVCPPYRPPAGSAKALQNFYPPPRLPVWGVTRNFGNVIPHSKTPFLPYSTLYLLYTTTYGLEFSSSSSSRWKGTPSSNGSSPRAPWAVTRTHQLKFPYFPASSCCFASVAKYSPTTFAGSVHTTSRHSVGRNTSTGTRRALIRPMINFWISLTVPVSVFSSIHMPPSGKPTPQTKRSGQPLRCIACPWILNSSHPKSLKRFISLRWKSRSSIVVIFLVDQHDVHRRSTQELQHSSKCRACRLAPHRLTTSQSPLLAPRHVRADRNLQLAVSLSMANPLVMSRVVHSAILPYPSVPLQ